MDILINRIGVSQTILLASLQTGLIQGVGENDSLYGKKCTCLLRKSISEEISTTSSEIRLEKVGRKAVCGWKQVDVI